MVEKLFVSLSIRDNKQAMDKIIIQIDHVKEAKRLSRSMSPKRGSFGFKDKSKYSRKKKHKNKGYE